ncbi:aldose epimerase family protein [Niallia sp. 01092]|uniref:aldose epimerase family protein n=1 Tax=unclassified Niallia TaxID=2837522 RepID=UPI003FD6A67E
MDKTQFPIFKLQEKHTNSWFCIAPKRGGIVTSIGISGEEVLYLNEETFHNSESNVRGGIPILFPICDRLKDETYTLNDKEYKMKNHGFARNLPWSVEKIDEDNSAITLVLESNAYTKQQYPFDFKLTFEFVLEDGVFIIKQSYHNKSDEKLPFYAGFHPYFKAVNKNLYYQSDTKTYLDVNDGKTKSVNGSLDLTDTIESLILLDSQQKSIGFPFSKDKELLIEYGEVFKYVTLWSEPGKPFICVEPWMAKPNAFNTKEDVQYIQPNETLHTFFKISLKDID